MQSASSRLPKVSEARSFCDREWSGRDGVGLYARDYPAAEGDKRRPVVCLHGMTRNSADFEDLAPMIAALHRRVIVPDIRGRGRSSHDPRPHNYHLWTYASDILDLMDVLDIDTAHFIGTSMGGLITMILSTLRPRLIKAAVLNDVGPYLSSSGLRRLLKSTESTPTTFSCWEEAANYAKIQNGIAFPEHTHTDWLDFAKRICGVNEIGNIVLAYDPAIFELVRMSANLPFRFDMSLPYLNLATGRSLLLIRGGTSDVLDTPAAIKMSLLSSHLTRVDIDGLGHAPMLTEPAAFGAVKAFLETQPELA